MNSVTEPIWDSEQDHEKSNDWTVHSKLGGWQAHTKLTLLVRSVQSYARRGARAGLQPPRDARSASICRDLNLMFGPNLTTDRIARRMRKP
jgi:hypothetical protein